MRHITRRRGRGRRTRLTHRNKRARRTQRGGGCDDPVGEGAILGTEGITNWLKDVFDRYASVPRLSPENPRFDVRFDELPIVPFKGDQPLQGFNETNYILPMRLLCEGDVLKADIESDPNVRDLYKLDGNYGYIIHSHVQNLSAQPTFREFSNAAGSFTREEAETGSVRTLLEIENILRTILRAGLNTADVEKYSYIAKNIRTLSDVETYPLYVWAVAKSITPTDTFLPVLVPSEEISEESTMQRGLVLPGE